MEWTAPAQLSARASTKRSEYAVGISSHLTMSAGDSFSERRRMGASIPASRSRIPSSTRATASQVAPASRAALATGASPCP